MTCKTDGCEKPVKVKKRQLCSNHFQQWARANRPKAGLRECSVEDCTKIAYAKNFCSGHYKRFRITGSPVPTPKVQEYCECGKEATVAGKCKTHYMQQWYAAMQPRAFDPNAINVKERVSYQGAHYRIRRTRGKASDYTCTDCPNPAREWALKFDAVNVHVNVSQTRMNGSRFSMDPNDYEPRCRPCHSAYDAEHKNTKRWAGVS